MVFVRHAVSHVIMGCPSDSLPVLQIAFMADKLSLQKLMIYSRFSGFITEAVKLRIVITVQTMVTGNYTVSESFLIHFLCIRLQLFVITFSSCGKCDTRHGHFSFLRCFIVRFPHLSHPVWAARSLVTNDRNRICKANDQICNFPIKNY